MISVIVPVYNVKPYLDTCIQSILNQTYQQFELYLINDGSTDGSDSLCEIWEKKDARIRYISKKHEQQGAARNVGIALSTGEYLSFVDADDWIHPCFLEKLLQGITDMQADIAVCDMYWAYPLDGEEEHRLQAKRLTAQYLVSPAHRLDGSIDVSFCNKLFRKKLFTESGIRFPVQYCEDLAALPCLFACSQKVSVVSRPLYYYRQGRADSTMSMRTSVQDVLNALQFIFDFLKARDWFELDKQDLFRLFAYHTYAGLRRYSIREGGTPDKIGKQARILLKNRFPQLPAQCAMVLGSYHLRCACSYTFGSLAYLHDLSFCSLISLMSDPPEIQTPTHPNWYRQRMLDYDCQKNWMDVCGGYDYLIIDLLEERFDVWDAGNGFVTNSDAWQEASLACGLSNWRLLANGTDAFFSLWKQACRKFADWAISHFAAKRIILVCNYLMTVYGDYSGADKFENTDEIEKTNVFLKRLYGVLKEMLPGSLVLDYDGNALCYTDRDFAYGCFPWHGNAFLYHQQARDLSEIMQSDKKGSL